MMKEMSGVLLREIPKKYQRAVIVLGLLLFAWLKWGPNVAAVWAAPSQIQATNLRLDSTNASLEAILPMLRDVHCVVKADAGIPGFTMEACALK